MVELQWEWLGGLPRLRRAAVIGAGPAARNLADALARARLEVDLAPRPEELRLERHDLVCLAVAPRELPAVVAALAGRIPGRAGVLVLSSAPGALPADYVAERVPARAVATLSGAEAMAAGEPLALASEDGAFLAQLERVLRAADLSTQTRRPRRSRAA
jgi:glycerol-3-phosphate dehydrogenase (NAD(P)+)